MLFVTGVQTWALPIWDHGNRHACGDARRDLLARLLASLVEHDLALVADPFNLESHFIDSDGLLAWSMFRDRPDHPFTPWDFTGPTGQEYTRLLDIVTASGATAYQAEYRHCGIYVCRIIVPGISEIYPLDDLFYGNRAGGAMLRRRLLELPALDRDGLDRKSVV